MEYMQKKYHKINDRHLMVINHWVGSLLSFHHVLVVLFVNVMLNANVASNKTVDSGNK